ncbi:MAG: HlyD family efflux transporter periplasmic adaptor subunit [Magnetococcales bacterium]|nr:HlyD family efflux transporter periplasmic adaptor subunit [Magnetococcales bacterium]
MASGAPSPPLSPEQQQLAALAALLMLEQKARRAASPREFAHVAVQETLQLFRYRQAVLWRASGRSGVVIEAVSGVDRPDPEAPYVRWLTGMLSGLRRRSGGETMVSLSREEAGASWEEGWNEWGVGFGLWAPLRAPEGRLPGGLWFSRDTPWTPGELALLERLAESYAHAWVALEDRQRRRGWSWSLSWGDFPWRRTAALLLLGAMFWPVHLSVLAPAQVAARDPTLITAPMEGVIASFQVTPNQWVNQGDPLFTLEDGVLSSRLEVARKGLDSAQAQFMVNRQRAFADPASKGELSYLQTLVEQRQAEVEYAAAQLNQSRVVAPRGGIVLLGDLHDWLGKPVTVGEKILTLADPKEAEAEIRLPVSEPLDLPPDAPITLFLNVDPLHPVEARLRHAGYLATPGPDGMLAYPLRARFVETDDPPRIGLQGTAKIHGRETVLGYLLFRRPWWALRQMIGW